MCLIKKHRSYPWRWCKIYWNIYKKHGVDTYITKNVHLVGVIEEMYNSKTWLSHTSCSLFWDVCSSGMWHIPGHFVPDDSRQLPCLEISGTKYPVMQYYIPQWTPYPHWSKTYKLVFFTLSSSHYDKGCINNYFMTESLCN